MFGDFFLVNGPIGKIVNVCYFFVHISFILDSWTIMLKERDGTLVLAKELGTGKLSRKVQLNLSKPGLKDFTTTLDMFSKIPPFMTYLVRYPCMAWLCITCFVYNYAFELSFAERLLSIFWVIISATATGTGMLTVSVVHCFQRHIS
jgi:hypothetical protein